MSEYADKHHSHGPGFGCLLTVIWAGLAVGNLLGVVHLHDDAYVRLVHWVNSWVTFGR